MIQHGRSIEALGQKVEDLRRENLANSEGMKDSLATTQTEITGAVRSELKSFRNARAIDQAFHMVADQSFRSRKSARAGIYKPQHHDTLLSCSNISDAQDFYPQRRKEFLHAVEWSSKDYTFVIGTLRVEHVESIDVLVDNRQNNGNLWTQDVSCRSKKIRFIF